ncbi:hypothetical protein JCM3765_002557 [Sporobolomyces pararoseus]
MTEKQQSELPIRGSLEEQRQSERSRLAEHPEVGREIRKKEADREEVGSGQGALSKVSKVDSKDEQRLGLAQSIPHSKRGIPSLLSLPDELLLSILEAGGPSFELPLLCKRLLPFYRLQPRYVSLYRSIKIKSFKIFQLLGQTLSFAPEITALVHELEVKLEMEAGAADGPTALQIEKFFDNLPNLKVLILKNFEEASRAFLNSNNLNCGPGLKAIHIEGTFGVRADPFSKQVLTCIAGRRKLSKVELVLHPSSRNILSRALPPSDLFFSSINPLALSGPLSASDSVMTILEHSEPSVILLHDTSSEPDLAELLFAFPSPRNVKALTISCQNCPSPPTQNYRKVLTRFSNLTYLKLSEGAMAGVGKGFYNALRKLLNLESLSFGPYCDVSAFQLCKLISGEKKHQALKVVFLNNIVSREGSKMDQYDLDGVDWKGKGWVVPDWTEKFPRKMLKEVQKAAKEGNVKMSGTTFEAEAVENAYRRRKQEWEDQMEEARWVCRKRRCYPEEAWEILAQRDERDTRWDIYDEEESEEDDEEENDERSVVDSKVWLT